jgi:hypothetical protein
MESAFLQPCRFAQFKRRETAFFAEKRGAFARVGSGAARALKEVTTPNVENSTLTKRTI